MNNKIIDCIIWVMTAIFMILTFTLPKIIPVHYGLNGVDSFGSRYIFILLSLLPIIIYYGMLYDIHHDPRKQTKENKDIFYLFRLILTGFFIIFVIYFYIISNFYVISVNTICFMGGILMILMGNYFPRIPPNNTLGIKTKWTLNNDIVWNRTHRVGGYLLVLCGIVLTLTSFIPGYICFYILIAEVIVNIGTIYVYSYKEYQKRND